MATFEEERTVPFSPLVPAQRMSYLPFSSKSCSNAYIELETQNGEGYGIELGSPLNPFSTLERIPPSETGQLDAYSGEVLDCNEFREFWIDWENGLIRLGAGPVRGENVLLSSQQDPSVPVSRLSFNSGAWRLPSQYRGMEKC